MKQQITLYTFITGYDKDYADTRYQHTELDMSEVDGYIFVGKQTVTVEVPNGDIQALADAHQLEVLTKQRLTLAEQQKALDDKIEALSHE